MRTPRPRRCEDHSPLDRRIKILFWSSMMRTMITHHTPSPWYANLKCSITILSGLAVHERFAAKLQYRQFKVHTGPVNTEDKAGRCKTELEMLTYQTRPRNTADRQVEHRPSWWVSLNQEGWQVEGLHYQKSRGVLTLSTPECGV